MGVSVKQVVTCTCDVCGSDCKDSEGEISIEVNGGDGRDVGPARLRARLVFDQPYGCVSGIVCKSCKFQWLAAYLSRHCVAPAATTAQQGASGAVPDALQMEPCQTVDRGSTDYKAGPPAPDGELVELLRQAGEEIAYQDKQLQAEDPFGLRQTPPRVARLLNKIDAKLASLR
jgi:hypothetical protein